MARTPSIMSLHLRYRFWIAEMNFFINVLRIFGDYLKQMTHKDNAPEVKDGIQDFEKQFIAARKEIDELRHEMHILKMKLGALAREGKTLTHESYKTDNHTALKKRYGNFRKLFDKVKTGFSDFEGRWMN